MALRGDIIPTWSKCYPCSTAAVVKNNREDEAGAEQSGNFSRTLFWWTLSVCIASLPEYQHQSGAARLHVHPEGTQTLQQLTYTGQEEASRPNMCPKGPLFLSHATLWGFSPRTGGGDEEIHLLTDSAILDFCYSPSVTWSAPTFTRGGLSPGENVIIFRPAWYMWVYM